MSRFLELIMEGIDIIQEAKKGRDPATADAPLFWGKGQRGARGGYITNKTSTHAKINAGLGAALGAAGGGLMGAGGRKLRAVKTAAGVLIGGGAGAGLGHVVGTATQANYNRMTNASFRRAGWKPISKKEYKKKEVKNRIIFPKEVIKKNIGY